MRSSRASCETFEHGIASSAAKRKAEDAVFALHEKCLRFGLDHGSICVRLQRCEIGFPLRRMEMQWGAQKWAPKCTGEAAGNEIMAHHKLATTDVPDLSIGRVIFTVRHSPGPSSAIRHLLILCDCSTRVLRRSRLCPSRWSNCTRIWAKPPKVSGCASVLCTFFVHVCIGVFVISAQLLVSTWLHDKPRALYIL